MNRVLDIVPRGYTRYMCGVIKLEKLRHFVQKMHLKYGVCATPAQRLTRKSKDIANALLVLHLRQGESDVQWLLLATQGEGLEAEALQDVTVKKLNWLGYELVRYASKGRTVWTWRRPKSAQADLYAALNSYLSMRSMPAVAKLLQVVANQPGFHGIRQQSKELFAHAIRHGYKDELPALFYVQKMSHGERLRIDIAKASAAPSH